MYTSRRAISQMLKQGSGSIVNVSSTAGISGGAAGAAYTVSKHGLVGLTRNTAWMYAQKGIRCNAILPGGTRTNIAETMPPERLDPGGAARAGAFAALIPAAQVDEASSHYRGYLPYNDQVNCYSFKPPPAFSNRL